jgi:aspartate aminotransferase-like enzyme
LIVTHSETSTGTACDMKAVAEAARRVAPDILIVVDGITSIGALPFEMDAWGVDVAITGSQKALMLPPGLGFVSLSERARKAAGDNPRKDKLYLDLLAYEKAMGNWDTPYTPNNQLIEGLRVSLQMILDEGLEHVWQRTHASAAAVRAGCSALGLEMFSQMPADSVSAIKLPAGVSDDDLRKPLKKKHNVHLAGGQGDMKGHLFRVNHMGYTDVFEALIAVSAIELVLADCGQDVESGAAVAAAQRTLKDALAG